MTAKGQKVLNMSWIYCKGKFQFTLKVNFSAKKQKVEKEPNLCKEKIPKTMPMILSKQMVLAHINGIYESFDLATEFTMKPKILMIQFWGIEGKNLGWDLVFFKNYFNLVPSASFCYKRKAKKDALQQFKHMITFCLNRGHIFQNKLRNKSMAIPKILPLIRFEDVLFSM